MNRKIQLIDWVDSCSNGNWVQSNETLKPIQCQTIGFLWDEDESSVTVCQNTAESSTHPAGELMCIPKAVIRRRKTIKP